MYFRVSGVEIRKNYEVSPWKRAGQCAENVQVR